MAMNEPIGKFGWSSSVIETLFFFGLMGAVFFAVGRKDYPDQHIILDTGLFLLSGILALLLWDMGGRINNPLPKHLAVSFAITPRQNNGAHMGENRFRSPGKNSIGALL